MGGRENGRISVQTWRGKIFGGRKKSAAYANDGSNHSWDRGNCFEEDCSVQNLAFRNRSNVPHGS